MSVRARTALPTVDSYRPRAMLPIEIANVFRRRVLHLRKVRWTSRDTSELGVLKMSYGIGQFLLTERDGGIERHCRNIRNEICETEGENLWYSLFEYQGIIRVHCSLNLTFANVKQYSFLLFDMFYATHEARVCS